MITPPGQRPARRFPRGRRGAVVAVAVLSMMAMGIGAAMAFWSATDSSNPAKASADALHTGSAPTGSATNQNVTLSWPAGSTVGGQAATGYRITRYGSATGGTPVPSTGGCSGTVAALICTEGTVPAGAWYYTVTPRLWLWVGSESPRTQINVNQAPTITSASSATFTVGVPGSFALSTTGFPTATVSESGALPSGVTLTNGTLSGTAAANTGGTYPITVTASNGTLPNAIQPFILTVDQSPSFSSPSGVTFTVGAVGTFSVQTTGFPTPPTISESGALPGGITFANNGNGTATLSGTPGSGTPGTYVLALTASNGVAPAATQTLTLTVVSSGATKLRLTASTTTPIAGVADSVTITALDGFNNVVSSYTGTKNLFFTGAGISAGGQSPTVTNANGVTATFGGTTTITFTNGVATVSSGTNGVMTLYKAEVATITVTDGAISNGSGLVVSVGTGSASRLGWTSLGAGGTLQTGCVFVCSWAGANNQTLTGKVSAMDSFGNVVANLGSGHTVTLTGVRKTPSPITLAIPATGAATTSLSFSYKADNGSWTTDTLTASDSPDSYSNAIVNITH